jgi:hypothetical protein
MKNIHTFEEFMGERVNEAKLVGDEWKAWLDIEEAIRGIYIKYNKKVDPKKISEFIQEQVDDYKKVGPKLN